MTFEKQQCHACRRIAFCVLVDINWYCENCYGWTKEYAAVKDATRKIMIDCGIEELWSLPAVYVVRYTHVLKI